MIANSPRTALWIGALAAASISFTACGGSNSGSATGDPEVSGSATGDPEAFCAKYEELDANVDLGDDDNEILTGLEDLSKLAPADLKGDLDDSVDAFKVFIEFNEKFEAGEEVDQEDAALVQASEKMDAAGVRIEAYVAETCGLDS